MQYDIVSAQTKNIAASAGYGSGKTRALCTRIAVRMMKYPGHNSIFWGPTISLLKNQPLKEMENVLSMLGVKYTVTRPDQMIVIKTKYGDIQFRSFKVLGNIRSLECLTNVVDELDAIPFEEAKDRFEQIKGRARGHEACSTTVASTPDQGTAGFICHLFEKYEDDEDWSLLKGKTRDNIFMPDLEGYIEDLKKTMSPEKLALYLEGEFVSLGAGLIYHRFTKECLKPFTELDKIQIISVGMDFNKGGCVAIIGYFDAKNKTYHAFDELVGDDTEELCIKIKEKYPNKTIWVYPDASGRARSANSKKSNIQIVRDHKLKVWAPKQNPQVEDRINTLNYQFISENLFVDGEKCPELVKSLEGHMYDTYERPTKYREHPALDDYNDALGYVVYSLIPIKIGQRDWKKQQNAK